MQIPIFKKARCGRMRAVRFSQYGATDVLQVVEAADPVPGEDEVLVRGWNDERAARPSWASRPTGSTPSRTSTPPAALSERTEAILARVRAIPEGFVRTYGDVSPGAPRMAGTVLAGAEDPSLPWHRIVRADGSLARGAGQRTLLLREGIPFRGDRVDMRVARMIGAVD
jgi:methylated-DNA-protein-cysteine methyltransferase-like protein